MTTRFGQSFQRFLHNFAALGFGQAVNLASQIFSIPLFLHFWSKTEYGEWLVLTSIPSLLWTLDNGLAGLAASRMTVASGRDDWGLANVIFRNVLLVQGLLSVAILGAAGVFAATCNTSAVFGFKRMSPHVAGTVLLLMIGYMLFGYCLGLLRAAYRASMQEARGITVSQLARLTGDFLMVVVILPLGGHALALATGMVGSMAFWALASYLDVRRRCPRIEFSFWPMSTVQLRAMFADGTPVMAGTAAGAFFLQGYPLIVNSLLGPVAVVTLTTIRTVSRILLQIVQMVSNASTSELSRTYGNRDWTGYLRLLKVMVAVTLWTALGAGLGLTLFGPWVIEKWTSGKVVVDHSLVAMFALSVACQSGWGACGIVLFSTNMHHTFNYAYFILTIAGLTAAYFVTRALGFPGVPLVMVVVDALLLLWALYLCRRKLTFIPLKALACVVQPSFYVQKLGLLIKRTA
jgi:O-antigen/teichoic acid export membrane protein